MRKPPPRPTVTFTADFVRDIATDVYKASLDGDDVERVMRKSADEGKDGAQVLRARAQFTTKPFALCC